jgi:hypothetical protein
VFVLYLVPFLRLLVEHSYGFFHIEIGVAVFGIAGLAAVVAAVARTRAAFNTVIVGSIVLLSVNTVHINFLPAVRTQWIIGGMTALLGCGMLALGRHFYQILLVFVLGTALGDVAGAVQSVQFSKSVYSTGNNYSHVVHIIFDEMIGLGAMPAEYDACVRAGATLQRSLERGNFHIYPYAFSNYYYTRDSIPSILNGHILDQTGEYLPPYMDRPFLHQNRYFDAYLQKNYAIRVYQSDYLRFDSPGYASVRAKTYKANDLKVLHLLNMSWQRRLKEVLTVYVVSDRFWVKILSRFGTYLDPIRVGPLSVRDVWPDRFMEDFQTATTNTLFFLHLMSPHWPYMYTSDGSIRDLPALDAPCNYLPKCMPLYCEQVAFLADQIDGVLKKIRATGLYDSTTIILHGDHGSRFFITESADEQRKLEISDDPSVELLLNYFATLLAIKLPDSHSTKVVTETGSVLYFLEAAFGRRTEPKDYDQLNSVYLFKDRTWFIWDAWILNPSSGADGSFRRIPLTDLWHRSQRSDRHGG